jgi:uncharacterized protein (TIGR02453 family)
MKKFSPLSTIQFLKNLAQNNKKIWLDAHRDEYKTIRENLKKFITDVHYEMQIVDPTLRNMDPAKSLFRINRDVRFSHDKSPYKTHMGAKFSATGAKKGIAGYGFGLSADGHLYIMGGINKLPTSEINLLRDTLIDQDGKMADIITNKKFAQNFELTDLGFGKLKNIPRGYDKESVHAEVLKLQAWWAMHRLIINEKNQDPKKLGKYIIEKLSLLKPLVTEMNGALFTKK